MNAFLTTLGAINWAGWLSAIATIIAIVYATASSRRERNIMLLDKRQSYLRKWERLIADIRKSIEQVLSESGDDTFNSFSFAMSFGERIGKTRCGEELKEELRRLQKEVATGKFIFEDEKIYGAIDFLDRLLIEIISMTPVDNMIMQSDITSDCEFLPFVQKCVEAMEDCVGIMEREMSLLVSGIHSNGRSSQSNKEI